MAISPRRRPASSTSSLKQSTGQIISFREAYLASIAQGGIAPRRSPFGVAVRAAVAAYEASGHMLDAALAYAEHGYPISPVTADTKSPVARADKDENGNKIERTGSFYKATINEQQIRKWWRRKEHLIAIECGPVSGIWMADVDTAEDHASAGVDGWNKLLAEHTTVKNRSGKRGEPRTQQIIPPFVTREHRSATGGPHVIFKWDDAHPISNSSGRLPEGIQIKSKGGYFILPPSRRKGRAYTVAVDVEPAAAPDWLYELLVSGHQGSSDAKPNEELIADNIGLLAYAVSVIPNDFKGRQEWKEEFAMPLWAATGGSDEGFVIFEEFSARWTKRKGPIGDTAHDVWYDELAKRPPNRIGAGTIFMMADKAKPGWRNDYQEQLWANVREALKERKASAQAEEKASAPPQESSQLDVMNARYSVVQDGGKVQVLMFERYVTRIDKYEHVRYVPAFLSFSDFRNKYCNQIIKEGKKKTALGQWWLMHLERRQYDGITFQPNGDEVIDNRLNLWKGWGIDPVEGDWSLMQDHILVVLADGNQEFFEYVMNWLAWCVQHPDRQAEVALVFKGKKGTGKGALGNAMMRIFGQHGVHLSDAKHLVGFNGHLRDACFLFADEAYWPGDKTAEGNFKRLITEPSLFIEGKHRQPVYAANMLHVMMAGNEEWIAPAGERERRFAVSNVSECHIQDAKWFDPLFAQLEDGGYAAMLFDLLHHGIANWHPRRFPKTAALLEQQEQSLSPLDAWWVELLEGGVLEGADPELPQCAVSNEYQTVEGPYDKTVRHRGLYDQARMIEPRLKRYVSDHILGRYLKEQGCKTCRVFRRRGWAFPALPKARADWEVRFPGWRWRDPFRTKWDAEIDGEDT
jgi:hypothetical protein